MIFFTRPRGRSQQLRPVGKAQTLASRYRPSAALRHVANFVAGILIGSVIAAYVWLLAG